MPAQSVAVYSAKSDIKRSTGQQFAAVVMHPHDRVLQHDWPFKLTSQTEWQRLFDLQGIARPLYAVVTVQEAAE